VVKKIFFLNLVLIILSVNLYSDFDPLKYDPRKSIKDPNSELSVERLKNKLWLFNTIKKSNKYLKTHPKDLEGYIVRNFLIFFLTTIEKNKADQYKYFEVGIKYCKDGLKYFPGNRFMKMMYVSFTTQKYLYIGAHYVLHNAEIIAKSLKQIVKEEPGCCFGRAAFFLGRMYYKLPRFPVSIGNLAKSKKYLNIAIKNNPALLAAYLSLADSEYNAGNIKSALNILKKAKKIKPKIWLDYYNNKYYQPGINVMYNGIKNNTWNGKDIFLIIKNINE